MVNNVSSQETVVGLIPTLSFSMWCLRMLSLYLCGLSQSSPASTHRPKKKQNTSCWITVGSSIQSVGVNMNYVARETQQS